MGTPQGSSNKLAVRMGDFVVYCEQDQLPVVLRDLRAQADEAEGYCMAQKAEPGGCPPRGSAQWWAAWAEDVLQAWPEDGGTEGLGDDDDLPQGQTGRASAGPWAEVFDSSDQAREEDCEGISKYVLKKRDAVQAEIVLDAALARAPWRRPKAAKVINDSPEDVA